MVAKERKDMTKRIIILCGGSNERWGSYMDIPRKHFVRLGGEILIHRTLRQIREFLGKKTDSYTAEIYIVANNDDHVKYYREIAWKWGAKLYIVEPPEKYKENSYSEAQKYLSSRSIWNAHGETILVLGDVYFSEAAIASILSYNDISDANKREWCFFGREKGSTINRCSWGELFAQSFQPKHHAKREHALWQLDMLYLTAKTKRASGWALYNLLLEKPLEQHSVFTNYMEIDDITDDIDFPEDYKRMIIMTSL